MQCCCTQDGAEKQAMVTHGKIGVFGASANPPHDGHIAAARVAKNALKLQKIIFLITPQNPHKDPATYASFEHRFLMAKMLAEQHKVTEWFEVSDLEQQIATETTAPQTFNTLQKMSQNPAFNNNLIWLMGSDNLANFHKWDQWEKLVNNFCGAIIGRGHTQNELKNYACGSILTKLIKNGTWHWLNDSNHNGCATNIRENSFKNNTLPHIPSVIEDYISQHNLYKKAG